MAQVTQSLVDEWKRALGKKLTPAFTTNEFDQLCFAWEELQRLKGRDDSARSLLQECGVTLRMWSDVAPAISLVADIEQHFDRPEL